jgi:FKBP-type peptidyl-prolyl cis-trans isomerase
MNFATPRILLMAAISLSLAVGAFAKPKTLKTLDTDMQKFSYAIGMDIGNYLKDQVGEVDMVAFQQALEGARQGQALLLTEEQAMEIKMSEGPKRQEAMASAKDAESKAFLDTNAKKPGVTTTESGLQYEVITAADGPKPTAADKVTVHYTGTLPNGKEFDSSVKRGTPATFPLGNVIPGWTEGVQLMSVGSKFRFVIPPALGYGERGAGNVIPPNSALVFEVELLKIEAPEEAPALEGTPEGEAPGGVE